MAVNACVKPNAIDALVGVTLKPVKVLLLTVIALLSVCPDKLAVMDTLPTDTLATVPLLLTVAMALLLLFQVTLLLTSAVEPSVYVPVAVKDWVKPRGIDTLAGFTAIENSETSFGLVPFIISVRNKYFWNNKW